MISYHSRNNANSHNGATYWQGRRQHRLRHDGYVPLLKLNKSHRNNPTNEITTYTGLTWREHPQSQEKSIEALKSTFKYNVNFWNGGELYGPPNANSLQLLNAYFTKYPEDADKIVLSIKGCLDLSKMAPDGTEEGVKKSIDNCLKVLDGKKKLDLFEAARVDPNVPIEDTIGYIKAYVDAGKVGGICLSEVSAESIRRAAKVAKIAGVEVEFSMFSTDILENGIAKACAELDIPIIAYSPLGRGFLVSGISLLQ